jgi:RHS repeat-associated protein
VVSADSFTYDAQGNQLTWTDGEGKVTQYTYDAFGEVTSRRDPTAVTTRYEYDANGNPSAFIDGAGNRTEFIYNGFNLLAQTKHGGQTLSSVTFNELNKPLTVTDALGRMTTYGYDCQGNLIQVTDPAGNITKYQVDSLANLKKVTDARNNQTNYLYDAANRQTGRTGPDNQTWSTGYTPDGYIQTTTTPNGATIQIQYDNMGRVTRETRPEKTIEFSYADCCRQSQVIERIGAVTRTTSYTYDSIGRLSSVTDPNNRTISYTYNGRGQRTSMTTPDGVATNYAYDDAGRVSEISVGANWARFSYDAVGRRTRALYSNGASNNYSYNTLGTLTSLVVRDAANTVIASYAYTLDANGNRTGVTYHDGSANYTLDTLNRLTSEAVNSVSLGNYSATYSYDSVGNRLDAGDTFSADNRLLNDAGGAYTYDNNGNLTARGARTFGYDSVNRLVSFSKPGVTATYQYDYLNRRVAKAVNGVTREFLYDGAQIVAEYAGGAQVARYVHGFSLDEPLIILRGGQAYFYHADGPGSVVAITNIAGQVLQRYGYDSWGNLRLNNGSFGFSGAGLVNTLVFTGREYDDESNLYHYRARTYDPAIGRFIQKDPRQGGLSQPQSQNLYPYALNNPQNVLDPTGEIALIEYINALDNYLNQGAAAYIGFFAGFGVTNLEFLGQFLAADASGSSLESAWEEAVRRTEEEMRSKYLGRNVIPLGKDVCSAKASVYITPVGFNTVTAFYTGFSVGPYLPFLGGLVNIQLGFSVPVGPDPIGSGGAICGTKLALERLRNLQPK